ncbi:hypothetical protein GGR52DRAFT_459711 [Hypoxylon sp. FL1284]|nr:hypothetical protein GGR52DRAFT_459711 [Hypoxylon sp. FL1284]
MLTKKVDLWMSRVVGRTWPPPQFNTYELALIEEDPRNPYLIDKLKTPFPDGPPVTEDLFHPLHVKELLCLIAMAKITEHSPLSIHPTPIAFTCRQGRKLWHNATGAQSKFYGTLDEFIGYAEDCFANRGKTLVLGVFNHLVGTPDRFESAYAGHHRGRSRSEYWANACQQKFIVIAVHKVGDRQFDVKLFDSAIAMTRLTGQEAERADAREAERETVQLSIQIPDHVWKVDYMERIERAFPGGDTWRGGHIYPGMRDLCWLQSELYMSCAFVWALATGELDINQLGGSSIIA